MKSSDKLLIGIVAGIVVLVIAAFVITLGRPEPTYQAEDTPQGVAHNYLLALQKRDFERAYGYLSRTLPGYPVSVEMFRADIGSYGFDENTTLAVESARVTGNRAEVDVRQSYFYREDPFRSSESSWVFKMELQLDGDEWKIVRSDNYFAYQWTMGQVGK
jgi:hypothetical protein